MKDQKELQAMHKHLLEHTVGPVQYLLSIVIKDGTNVHDLDMLSIYISMDGLSEKWFLVRKYYFVVGKKIKGM
jgi:hypothetical protein